MTFPKKILRQQLAWLRARYDGGAIPAGIYRTIKIIEVELSWHDHHRARHTNPCSRADTTAQRERR
jgi:hypothetical protein